MINLPLSLAILGSIILVLFNSARQSGRFEYARESGIFSIMFLVIAFNLALFLGERHPSRAPICFFSVLLFGSGLLVYFVLFSKSMLGKTRGNSVRLKLVLSAVGKALLFDYLFYLLSVDIIEMDHPEIAVVSLSGIVLFGAILLMLFLNAPELNIEAKSLQQIATFFAVLLALITVFIVLKSERGLLIGANLLFILMLFTLLIASKRKKPLRQHALLSDFNLTNRQTQVARLMMKGFSYSEIADKLSIAESTASKHGSDIFAKTSSQDRMEFFAKFFEEFQLSREDVPIYYPQFHRVREK